MKIGVNARLLTKPFTGIGQYTKNLFSNLGRIDKKNEYILVVPEKVDKSIADSFPKNIILKVLPEKKLGTLGMRKTWWEQIAIPEFFQKEKVNIAFFTYPSNPWSDDWRKKGIKTAVAVHDCIPWMRKEYRKGLLSSMYHFQTKKAVKKADIVFTVSESSKKDIEKVCGINPRKIHVVYNDADDIYKKPVDAEFSAKVLKQFGLRTGKFFLYAGGYDERKNVDYLTREYRGKYPLVLAGGCEKAGENIIKTGFLEAEKLACLYSNCKAFINLSLHEGFNIPVVEAANCGAPLILSDIPVHKEIAGDAAIFVNVNKKGEVMKAIKKIENKKIRKKYSWKSSAQKVKDVLFSK